MVLVKQQQCLKFDFIDDSYPCLLIALHNSGCGDSVYPHLQYFIKMLLLLWLWYCICMTVVAITHNTSQTQVCRRHKLCSFIGDLLLSWCWYLSWYLIFSFFLRVYSQLNSLCVVNQDDASFFFREILKIFELNILWRQEQANFNMFMTFLQKNLDA